MPDWTPINPPESNRPKEDTKNPRDNNTSKVLKPSMARKPSTAISTPPRPSLPTIDPSNIEPPMLNQNVGSENFWQTPIYPFLPLAAPFKTSSYPIGTGEVEGPVHQYLLDNGYITEWSWPPANPCGTTQNLNFQREEIEELEVAPNFNKTKDEAFDPALKYTGMSDLIATEMEELEDSETLTKYQRRIVKKRSRETCRQRWYEENVSDIESEVAGAEEKLILAEQKLILAEQKMILAEQKTLWYGATHKEKAAAWAALKKAMPSVGPYTRGRSKVFTDALGAAEMASLIANLSLGSGR
ncbi:MAG: hypothetical protein M1814_002625 [Vezdaea aestivalis]|nr:MAG: hypothetical protein M1814_002625 [Vezdaea aestivalis]